MNRTDRLAAAFGIALVLAVGIWQVSASGGCHPASCHLWDSTDLWWWWYECWTPHCDACGYNSNLALRGVFWWIVG